MRVMGLSEVSIIRTTTASSIERFGRRRNASFILLRHLKRGVCPERTSGDGAGHTLERRWESGLQPEAFIVTQSVPAENTVKS